VGNALSEDATLREQLDYYRARATEYDQWWLRQGRYDRGSAENRSWFEDCAAVASALERFRPSGRILELACGTGIWSEKLLPFASQLTLVDGSREMLEIAAHRLQSTDVRYMEANIFDWTPQQEFDTVFFSFWLSHVPPARFDGFFALIARCLAPGGRIFFVDSRHEQTSTAIDHRLPDQEAMQLQRRLNDGREFRIYKIFYRPDELRERLGKSGWNIRTETTERYFIHGQGCRSRRLE